MFAQLIHVPLLQVLALLLTKHCEGWHVPFDWNTLLCEVCLEWWMVDSCHFHSFRFWYLLICFAWWGWMTATIHMRVNVLGQTRHTCRSPFHLCLSMRSFWTKDMTCFFWTFGLCFLLLFFFNLHRAKMPMQPYPAINIQVRIRMDPPKQTQLWHSVVPPVSWPHFTKLHSSHGPKMNQPTGLSTNDAQQTSCSNRKRLFWYAWGILDIHYRTNNDMDVTSPHVSHFGIFRGLAKTVDGETTRAELQRHCWDDGLPL